MDHTFESCAHSLIFQSGVQNMLLKVRSKAQSYRHFVLCHVLVARALS